MEDADAQEREHFKRIVSAFKYYRTYALDRISARERYLKTLPVKHQNLLENYRRQIEQQRVCIEHNNEIIKLIIKDVESMFENVQHEQEDETCCSKPLQSDMEKVQSTLRQIVRDWSSVGETERRQCYQPIIEEIERLFPRDQINTSDVHILVPGSGLGRLAYDLAKKGYTCQGNEFSLFMLFASNFILNRCHGVNSLYMYPWVHTVSNVVHNSDQVRAVPFPDVEPSDLPPSAHFTMAAGDFLEVYSEEEQWDCVATCFFIDCANNIVACIEAIYKILKQGGYWLNLGPLLYHYSDQPGEDSIEPSFEEVRSIVTGIGFKIMKEETDVPTTYTQNMRSMLRYEYKSVFFVAKKT